jgi:hypothetical protein
VRGQSSIEQEAARAGRQSFTHGCERSGRRDRGSGAVRPEPVRAVEQVWTRAGAVLRAWHSVRHGAAPARRRRWRNHTARRGAATSCSHDFPLAPAGERGLGRRGSEALTPTPLPSGGEKERRSSSRQCAPAATSGDPPGRHKPSALRRAPLVIIDNIVSDQEDYSGRRPRRSAGCQELADGFRQPASGDNDVSQEEVPASCDTDRGRQSKFDAAEHQPQAFASRQNLASAAARCRPGSGPTIRERPPPNRSHRLRGRR